MVSLSNHEVEHAGPSVPRPRPSTGSGWGLLDFFSQRASRNLGV